jgi:hypothetical protein
MHAGRQPEARKRVSSPARRYSFPAHPSLGAGAGMTSNHNQHWAARRRSGACSIGAGYAAPAIVGYQSYRTSKVQFYSGRVFSLSPVSPTGPTCRGIRASAFYSIARWPLSSLSDRRLVLLLPVRAATDSSNVAHEVRRRPGASCRGAQFSLRFSGGSSHLRVPKHSACKLSDASERHSLERLSCDRVAMTNRDTPERPKSWKLKPTRTAS